MFRRDKEVILPSSKIGIVGGGQLGRMLAFEAKRMGHTVIVLDPKEDCPTAQVCDRQIVGSLHDESKIRELAECTDVVTYEFELVNADVLCQLKSEGFKIYPSGETLKKIQNKYIQKSVFKEAGLPVPEFMEVKSREDIEEGIKRFGFPLVIKSCTGGYDGKGNFIIKQEDEVEETIKDFDFNKHKMMIEEFVDFQCEISIVIACNTLGEMEYFPVVENTHEDSILKITKAPAKVSEEIKTKVKSIAKGVLEVFNDAGVFCIELFLTKDGKVYINEVAPRPHNSGHYTIEACVTSQFEQQLRAVTGLKLGSTKLLTPAVMVNVLGTKPAYGEFVINGLDKLIEEEGVYFHFYGKPFVDVKKKVGHITVIDSSVDVAEEKALKALDYLDIEQIGEAN